MLFPLVACLLCLARPTAALNTTNATLYDASASERRAAFANVSVPVTNVSTPLLRNVTTIPPNATLVYPNGSQSSIESAGAFDYPTALELVFRYFAAERLGALPPGNDVPWRADSFLDDPVPGGLGDAGDFLKVNIALSQTLALSAMSVLEFPAAYTGTGSLDAALDALRWGLDFLIACRTDDVTTVVSPFRLPEITCPPCGPRCTRPRAAPREGA